MSSQLESPQTIRKLWIGFWVVLILLVLADFLYLLFDEDSKQIPHGSGIDATFAFNAWYGLLACAVLVLVSKGLALVLKRREEYYDE